MKRNRGRRPHARALAHSSVRMALPLAGILLAALLPVYAGTVTKQDKQNTIASSNRQYVRIYGLAPLSLSSTTTAFTTKAYNSFSSAPYPYASSTNTRALFTFSGATVINKNEYGTSTVSTVDPAVGLSVSDWAWYSSGTRLGAVGGPSLYRRRGPSSFDDPPRTPTPRDWVSIRLTMANTMKPLRFENDQYVPDPQAERRPNLILSYTDFGVGLVPCGRTRAAEIQVERALSQLAIAHVNPRSRGELAPPTGLVHNCNPPRRTGRWVDLLPGRSCADETHTTNFVAAVVPGGRVPEPSPDPTNPVTAHLVSMTPGRDQNGNLVDPTLQIQSANRRLIRVTLPPGAAVTYQIKMLLGAVHLPQPVAYNLLFVTRMRELAIGSEETVALYTGVLDYGACMQTDPAGLPAPPQPTTVQPRTFGPRDRQHWAHLLALYNRSLRCYEPTPPSLRTGRF
ncbi:MAG: hypothetical protein HY320_01730 [Armatimonadetes bacterium]|nr:hypothetical protein [Armatimonadota bacterium]